MTSDFDQAVKQSRAALDEIAKGRSAGFQALYSRAEEVTLGNPFGGFARGWDECLEQMERAASHYRDGETTGFETVTQLETDELAYTVEIERFRVRVGDSAELSDVALRVTSIYRREGDDWKLIHRHADPRVDRQTVESVLASASGQ